uniref:Thymidylate kinase n=1 Tax=Candidatus Kentrum sp. SD TaxID=2126332 RepID=A0A450YLY7_9GAMM|nr:MAG: dTMP kinase [Candidatus Kentron sp. SD]VFK48525.1 MAG: dTMP kinase [Candidatus Kentron sp. SD]
MLNESEGILIVFDGIDGAGKTTQVNLLDKLLQDSGKSTCRSKEPTNGEWGQKVRMSARHGRMPIKEELNAFLMDRHYHIDKIISPALRAGKIVILDRYYYSTICYQSARGVDIEDLHSIVTSNIIVPDVSFILDVDVDIAQSRIAKRSGHTNSFEDPHELRKVRVNYQRIRSENMDNCKYMYKLDASQSINVLHKAVVEKLIDTIFYDKMCEKKNGCYDKLNCGFRLTNSCQWFNLRSKFFSKIREVSTNFIE